MSSVQIRLSVMMFLQYFTWGAWFVTLGTYLGSVSAANGERLFTDEFIGYAYGTSAIAAIFAPFLVGLIADRYFATERMLAVLHLAGAGLMYAVASMTSGTGMYVCLVLYFLAYMPTLALTNSISFHHLKNPAAEFPMVRVLGTIGWIAAGWVVGSLRIQDGQWGFNLANPFGLPFSVAFGEELPAAASIEPTNYPMLIAIGSQVLLAIYCLLLPHTPPNSTKDSDKPADALGLGALSLMKKLPFAVFVIGSFLICIPLQFYYTFTNPFLNELGWEGAATKQTYGQVSEILFMVLIPFFFARLGVKWMLLIGMAAWAIRYVLFAYGDIDSGTWMLYAGILLHGICYDFFFVTGQIYVDNKAPASVRGAAQGFITFVTLGLGLFAGSLLSGQVVGKFATPDGLVPHDWQSIWLVPAAMAGVVLVLFGIFFHEKGDGSSENSADTAA